MLVIADYIHEDDEVTVIAMRRTSRVGVQYLVCSFDDVNFDLGAGTRTSSTGVELPFTTVQRQLGFRVCNTQPTAKQNF